MTDSSSAVADLAVLESKLEALAAEAVSKLEMAGTIQHLRLTLFEQIEKCDEFAGVPDDSLFIATSLPLANALIHYAANQYALRRAREWAQVRWPDQDPTSMLASLTLIYIVQEGVKAFGQVPQRRDAWERIHRRIETILQAEPREAAVA